MYSRPRSKRKIFTTGLNIWDGTLFRGVEYEFTHLFMQCLAILSIICGIIELLDDMSSKGALFIS